MPHRNLHTAIDLLVADELEPLMATYRELEILLGDAHQIQPANIAQLMGYLNDHFSQIHQKIQNALKQEPQAL